MSQKTLGRDYVVQPLKGLLYANNPAVFAKAADFGRQLAPVSLVGS